MITTYVSVLLYEEPWILTSNASMYIWINRLIIKFIQLNGYLIGQPRRPD